MKKYGGGTKSSLRLPADLLSSCVLPYLDVVAVCKLRLVDRRFAYQIVFDTIRHCLKTHGKQFLFHSSKTANSKNVPSSSSDDLVQDYILKVKMKNSSVKKIASRKRKIGRKNIRRAKDQQNDDLPPSMKNLFHPRGKAPNRSIGSKTTKTTKLNEKRSMKTPTLFSNQMTFFMICLQYGPPKLIEAVLSSGYSHEIQYAGCTSPHRFPLLHFNGYSSEKKSKTKTSEKKKIVVFRTTIGHAFHYLQCLLRDSDVFLSHTSSSMTRLTASSSSSSSVEVLINDQWRDKFSQKLKDAHSILFHMISAPTLNPNIRMWEKLVHTKSENQSTKKRRLLGLPILYALLQTLTTDLTLQQEPPISKIPQKDQKGSKRKRKGKGKTVVSVDHTRSTNLLKATRLEKLLDLLLKREDLGVPDCVSSRLLGLPRCFGQLGRLYPIHFLVFVWAQVIFPDRFSNNIVQRAQAKEKMKKRRRERREQTKKKKKSRSSSHLPTKEFWNSESHRRDEMAKFRLTRLIQKIVSRFPNCIHARCVSQKSELGLTALHLCCIFCQDVTLAKLLLSAGARISDVVKRVKKGKKKRATAAKIDGRFVNKDSVLHLAAKGAEGEISQDELLIVTTSGARKQKDVFMPRFVEFLISRCEGDMKVPQWKNCFGYTYQWYLHLEGKCKK